MEESIFRRLIRRGPRIRRGKPVGFYGEKNAL